LPGDCVETAGGCWRRQSWENRTAKGSVEFDLYRVP
jgi:hypothetical protein